MYYLLSTLLEKLIGKLRKKKKIMKNLSVGRNVGSVPEKDKKPRKNNISTNNVEGLPVNIPEITQTFTLEDKVEQSLTINARTGELKHHAKRLAIVDVSSTGITVIVLFMLYFFNIGDTLFFLSMLLLFYLQYFVYGFFSISYV